MIRTTAVAKLLCAATLVVTLIVGVGVRGPVPGVVTLVFIGFAPGLALSLHMGSMAGEARLLLAAVGSAAVGAVVSVALLYAGLWSGRLGFLCIAIVTGVAAGTAIGLDRPSARGGHGERCR